MTSVLQNLKPSMLSAGERVDRHGSTGVTELFGLALIVAMIGLALTQFSSDYHAGFKCIHPITHMILPDGIWAWLTRLGDAYLLLALTLLFARNRPEIFWALVVAILFGAAYSKGLKISVDALRPPAILADDALQLIGPALKSHSFPSGHTLSAFMFAGVLFAYTKSWPARLLLLVAATLAGLSRVALGVHWPHDVLAGAFGGLMAAGLGVWVSYYWRLGLKPTVHLVLIILPIIGILGLLFGDGDNPPTPVLAYLLAFAMACQLLLDYRSYRQS